MAAQSEFVGRMRPVGCELDTPALEQRSRVYGMDASPYRAGSNQMQHLIARYPEKSNKGG